VETGLRIMGRRVLLCLAVLLIFGASSPAWSQPIESNMEFHYYTGIDGENKSIEQICCSARPEDWQKARRVSNRYSQPVAWLKLPPVSATGILEFRPLADEITLYERQGDVWSIKKTGDTIALSQRSLNSGAMALRLNQSKNNDIERYVRISQPSTATYSLHLWSEDGFAKSIQQRLLIRLVILGFCSAMLAFNLVVALITKEDAFAYNAATVFCLIIAAIYLSGEGGYWLWPESPEWSNWSLIFSLGGLSLFATRFISSILKESSLSEKLLRYNRWQGTLLFLISMVVIATDSLWAHALMMLLVFWVTLSQFGLVLLSVAKGDRQTLPLLIPFPIFLISLFIIYMGVAHSRSFGWWGYHIVEIALAIEAITFSLILAARIRVFATKAASVERDFHRLQIDSAERFSDLQDHERSRMASDLHDSIGHNLAIAVGQLGKANQKPGLSKELSQRLQLVRLSVKEAILETRRISHDLHPVRFDHLGFHKGLHSLFDDLANSHNIMTTVSIDCENEILTAEEQSQIGRIAQESVSNIAKHSQATHCWFEMVFRDGEVFLEIKDNGIGSTDADDNTADHLGIISIQQRVMRLGGTLTIDGTQDGFIIRFSFIPKKQRTS